MQQHFPFPTDTLKQFIRDFLRCGLSGWCLEILFTALHSLRRQDLRLKGTTSLWMFPIYGCAACLKPVFYLLRKSSLFLRGGTYMILIYSAEYLSGRFLNRHRLCPWDYSRSRYHIGKVIRLDYAPCWFAVGLFFEHMLMHTQLQDETTRIPSRPLHKQH